MNTIRLITRLFIEMKNLAAKDGKTLETKDIHNRILSLYGKGHR